MAVGTFRSSFQRPATLTAARGHDEETAFTEPDEQSQPFADH